MIMSGCKKGFGYPILWDAPGRLEREQLCLTVSFGRGREERGGGGKRREEEEGKEGHGQQSGAKQMGKQKK